MKEIPELQGNHLESDTRTVLYAKNALRKKCLYSELFWSVFYRIRAEYGEISVFRPNSGKCGPEHNNSEYRYFSCSDADTNYPGNIVIRANDSDIAVILICNIHHIKSDGWYDPEHNYENSRESSKSLMLKMFLHCRSYAFPWI